jgi:hypothetical protein
VTVVDLVPRDRDADAPVRTRPRRPGKRLCLHYRVELDHDVRRVYCRDCEQEVDAFDALTLLARDFERWTVSRDRAHRETRQAQAILDEVKRELRNAKARRRRQTLELTREPDAHES